MLHLADHLGHRYLHITKYTHTISLRNKVHTTTAATATATTTTTNNNNNNNKKTKLSQGSRVKPQLFFSV